MQGSVGRQGEARSPARRPGFFALRDLFPDGIREPVVPCWSQASTRRLSDTHNRRAGFMKRRDFLKVTGIATAGAASMAAPAIAQSMPEIKWRLTASWP